MAGFVKGGRDIKVRKIEIVAGKKGRGWLVGWLSWGVRGWLKEDGVKDVERSTCSDV